MTKRFKVLNRCKHCHSYEEYTVDAEDANDAEMSMKNFQSISEELGKLENVSCTELYERNLK